MKTTILAVIALALAGGAAHAQQYFAQPYGQGGTILTPIPNGPSRGWGNDLPQQSLPTIIMQAPPQPVTQQNWRQNCPGRC